MIEVRKCTDCSNHWKGKVPVCGEACTSMKRVCLSFNLPTKNNIEKVTLLHELAHIHLGHYGAQFPQELDAWMWVHKRRPDLFKDHEVRWYVNTCLNSYAIHEWQGQLVRDFLFEVGAAL